MEEHKEHCTLELKTRAGKNSFQGLGCLHLQSPCSGFHLKITVTQSRIQCRPTGTNAPRSSMKMTNDIPYVSRQTRQRQTTQNIKVHQLLNIPLAKSIRIAFRARKVENHTYTTSYTGKDNICRSYHDRIKSYSRQNHISIPITRKLIYFSFICGLL